MPRKDQIHDAVRNALLKDGWTITDDPFRIVYEDADVYADLRIVKTEAGASIQRALVIEIKSFIGYSPLHNLEIALGQYELYRIYLESVAPDDKLYLAVSATTYAEQFTRPAFTVVLQEKRLPLLVVDTGREEVVRWIN
uniref:FdxN element excision controlling factor protein n=1 Tax=uncultured Armatimonadetes bacterium TaxID=157466 RepID=A0A6J4JMI8_9BACT|nr:hypothetical protein AVDCRST_MAG63-3676 [uncultured Armatimonadetes bacterium]